MRDPEGLRDRIGHAILHRGQYRILELDAVVLLLLRLAVLEVPTLDSRGDPGAGKGRSAIAVAFWSRTLSEHDI